VTCNAEFSLARGCADWTEEIALALRRGKSVYDLPDFVRLLISREIVMAAAPCLRASVWFRPDGAAEVAHLAGRWCEPCAMWLHDEMRSQAAARGISFVEIDGRPGWRRFLEDRRIIA